MGYRNRSWHDDGTGEEWRERGREAEGTDRPVLINRLVTTLGTLVCEEAWPRSDGVASSWPAVARRTQPEPPRLPLSPPSPSSLLLVIRKPIYGAISGVDGPDERIIATLKLIQRERRSLRWVCLKSRTKFSLDSYLRKSAFTDPY